MNPTEIQKYLGGVDYPASKGDILTQAQKNNAPQEALDALNKLPDRQYDSPTDVTGDIS